jgi:hypothetical protein
MIERPFAGGEHKFAFGYDEAVEWERLRRKSLYRTALEMEDDRWFMADVIEVVRLGLIGAGMPQSEADDAVEYNVRKRPLAENRKLVLAILDDAYFGPKEETKTEEATE